MNKAIWFCEIKLKRNMMQNVMFAFYDNLNFKKANKFRSLKLKTKCFYNIH